MRQISMPSWLHEALGKEQSAFSLVAIFGFGVLATLAVVMADASLRTLVPWRLLLAALLIFDIAAGCVANFTPGTNHYYAQRPRGRWLFIAVHIHLPAVAVLAGWPMVPTLAIWAWTIAAAALVNAMRGHRLQAMVAGLSIASGLAVVPIIAATSPGLLIVGPLFLLKVAYAFAVDHQGGV